MSKAEAIVAHYKNHPDATRKEVAKAVKCTVQRVGEVIRAGLVESHPVKDPVHWQQRKRDQRAEKKDEAAGEPAAEPEPAEQPLPEPATGDAPTPGDNDVRHERCEHEKRRKVKTGACRECPRYEAA